MFLILFIILLLGWMVGWGVFHVAGVLIHILLLFALISIIIHLFRGRRTA
ncbi:MAG: lmo0937 family membrane protein [Terriglobia bacterium]